MKYNLKKICLLILVCISFAMAANAQDVITMTNGSQIQAKVLQINPDDVVYKDYNNQDGPTITIRKAGVASILYANGSKTVFNEVDRPSSGSFTRSSGHRSNDNGGGYRRTPGSGGRIHGWYFGAQLGFGASGASSNDPTYSTSSGAYDAENILATKMFTQHLGIQFGLGTEDYGYNTNFNSLSSAPGNDYFSVNCLTIPARVVYFSNSKKRVGLYVLAGFDLTIVATARDNEQDDLTNYYNTVLLSPYISAGVEFRTRNSRGVWMFGPYYKTTVSNVYSGESGNNGNFYSAGLSIQYMAKFGRR